MKNKSQFTSAIQVLLSFSLCYSSLQCSLNDSETMAPSVNYPCKKA